MLENLLRICFSTTVDGDFVMSGICELIVVAVERIEPNSLEFIFIILLSLIILCLSTTLIALSIDEHFVEHFLLLLTR